MDQRKINLECYNCRQLNKMPMILNIVMSRPSFACPAFVKLKKSISLLLRTAFTSNTVLECAEEDKDYAS